MRLARLLPVLVALFTAAPASAQVSIWLKRGVSGYGASVGVSRSDVATTGGVSLGYSYQGWIDFDLTYNYIAYDDDFFIFDANEIVQHVLIPAVQWHLIKQSPSIPVSFALAAAVPISVLESDTFSDDAGGSTIGVGASASVYRFFRLGSNIGITPAAAAAINYSRLTLKNVFGEEIDLGDDANSTAAVFTFGAYIAYLDSGGRIWGVAPQVSINDDGDAEFGITLNLIFSQLPPEPPAPPPPPQ